MPNPPAEKGPKPEQGGRTGEIEVHIFKKGEGNKKPLNCALATRRKSTKDIQH